MAAHPFHHVHQIHQIHQIHRRETIKQHRRSAKQDLCSFSARLCQQNKLDGFDYCLRHILEDKTAPYKQCNYVYPKNGKRCPNAAAKGEKKSDGYCNEHHKKAALMRAKLSRKYRPIENPETLLEEIEYAVNNEEAKGNNNNSNSNSNLNLNLNLNLNSNNDNRNNDLFHDVASSCSLPQSLSAFNQELFSDPESERETPLLEQTAIDDDDSDADSVDSEHEDPLKHAGVYTAEEAALITRDKLIRLQSLYIEQFKRLQYVLKEKRRKYLNAVKVEKETMGSIAATPRNTNDTVRHYKRMKAAIRYHRRYGQELVMHRREKEKRRTMSATSDSSPNRMTAATTPSINTRCQYVNNSERCSNRTLPLSKFCTLHILYDPHQVLFRPCGSSNSCKRPIIRAVDGNACIIHSALPSHLVLDINVNPKTSLNKGLSVDHGGAGAVDVAVSTIAVDREQETKNDGQNERIVRFESGGGAQDEHVDCPESMEAMRDDQTICCGR